MIEGYNPEYTGPRNGLDGGLTNDMRLGGKRFFEMLAKAAGISGTEMVKGFQIKGDNIAIRIVHRSGE